MTYFYYPYYTLAKSNQIRPGSGTGCQNGRRVVVSARVIIDDFWDTYQLGGVCRVLCPESTWAQQIVTGTLSCAIVASSARAALG